MRSTDDYILTLNNFEGPIDFLLHLVQKSEIDVSEIALHEITSQYLERLKESLIPSIDSGAEFVGATASLLLAKSRQLLPKHEQQLEGEIEMLDPRFDIIHQLIDYCRFKEVAKSLKDREEQQGIFYPRGVHEIPEIKRGLGVEHLSLEDLASLFQQVLTKSTSATGLIQQEIWRVSDKMQYIRKLLEELGSMKFELLFNSAHFREELIISFLAILELMKQGEACVVKEKDTGEILIMQQKT